MKIDTGVYKSKLKIWVGGWGKYQRSRNNIHPWIDILPTKPQNRLPYNGFKQEKIAFWDSYNEPKKRIQIEIRTTKPHNFLVHHGLRNREDYML